MTTPKEPKEHVEELMQKARDARTAGEALHYSQAACNVATAARLLNDL